MVASGNNTKNSVKPHKHWVHYYEQFGDSELLKSGKNNEYSFQFKLWICVIAKLLASA